MRAMRYALAAEYLRPAWALKPETAALMRHMLLADHLDLDPSALGRRAAADEVDDHGAVGRIPLRGMITPRTGLLNLLFGGGGLDAFRSQLAAAVADDEISTILLDVDSPGGSTDLVHEAAQDVQRARASKPVVAVANTEAASAAYWIASQADELVVTPSGAVGSVGVFALHVDESGFNEKLGITPTFISAGKYKIEGNPHEPLSDDAREYAQSVVDSHYDRFVSDIATGRGTTARSVKRGFGEGRMVMAERAVEEGMADRVDTFESTVGRLLDEGAKPARRRRAKASAAASTVSPVPDDDEDRRDEDPQPDKSRSQVERRADQALVDQAIAASTR